MRRNSGAMQQPKSRFGLIPTIRCHYSCCCGLPSIAESRDSSRCGAGRQRQDLTTLIPATFPLEGPVGAVYREETAGFLHWWGRRPCLPAPKALPCAPHGACGATQAGTPAPPRKFRAPLFLRSRIFWRRIEACPEPRRRGRPLGVSGQSRSGLIAERWTADSSLSG